MNSDECPIFPLKSIVLPGGVFPLRIFERRYLDMVTKCIKEDTGFCIALVQKEDRNKYIDQVIRPTGLIDPPVEIRPAKTQVDDLFHESKKVLIGINWKTESLV